MRILEYGIEVKVSEETIRVDENGDAYTIDEQVKRQVEEVFGREVKRIFLMPGNFLDPLLWIEWKYYWREDEEDRYTLDHFAYSDDELEECFRLGVL